jgi:magnesium transporter
MCVEVFLYEHKSGLKTYDTVEVLNNLPSKAIAWIDIESDDEEILSTVSKQLGLHELTIEDCLTPGHFPKLESFGNYHFMIFRGLIPAQLADELSEEEDQQDGEEEEEEEEKYTRAVAMYYSDNFILTHRRRDVPWLDAVARQVKQYPEIIIGSGTQVLAHRIIDVLIDRFLRGLNHFENIIDQKEDSVIIDPESFQMSEILELKRTLAMLRQIMRDQRTVIGRLAHDSSLIRDQRVRRYFRDIEDHSKAIIKTLDQQIETLHGVRDVYFALVNVRLGDIMRILAVITTVAVPLNLVTGLYGMNFEGIPLLHHPRGFWFIAVVMMLLVILLLVFFRRKKWL